MPRKLTQEEVIAKFIAVHGTKYDYSVVEYAGMDKKVKIICPVHGFFTQTPSNHINRRGCSKCKTEERAKRQRKTTDEFILEAKAKHGDKYNYSKTVYKSARDKVVIICPKHGEFEQDAFSHLSGCGCPKCGVEYRALKTSQRLTLSHVEQVNAIHAKNHNIEVLGMVIKDNIPVLCRCKICNHEWLGRPNHLKKGYGCPKCGGTMKLTHEEQVAAINKVNPCIEILGEITKDMEKVLCRCKICNHKWEARPSALKEGKGCPKCAQSGFLSHEHGNLYIMVDDLEVPTMMKIGVSVRVDGRRKDVLKSAKKVGAVFSDLHVIKTWEGPTENMHSLEKAMHKALSQYKINFPTKFDGCQEFFYYRPEVFELVEEHLKKLSKQ